MRYYPVQSYELIDAVIFKKHGGVIHLNSNSCYDLIFSNFRFAKTPMITKNAIDRLVSETYFDYSNAAILDFIKNFVKLKKMEPMIEYTKIHQLFNRYDTKYFIKKSEIFQNEIIHLFTTLDDLSILQPDNLSDFIANFIIKLKRDIITELVLVHNHFSRFPYGRRILQQKYPHHPYIKLIKMIHQICSQNDLLCNFHVVEKIFYRTPTDFVVYDELMNLLILSIQHRHQLFNDYYHVYLNTKNICNKSNFFPFKIFSDTLFAMGHFISTINNASTPFDDL